MPQSKPIRVDTSSDGCPDSSTENANVFLESGESIKPILNVNGEDNQKKIFEYDAELMLVHHVNGRNYGRSYWYFMLLYWGSIFPLYLFGLISDIVYVCGLLFPFLVFVFRWLIIKYTSCGSWFLRASENIPKTYTTATRIEIEEPERPAAPMPTGGEIFIPFHDVVSIESGITPTIIYLEKTFSYVKIIFAGSDLNSYKGRGHPRIVTLATEPQQFAVVLIGLKDPDGFKRAVLDGKLNASAVRVVEAIPLNDIV